MPTIFIFFFEEKKKVFRDFFFRLNNIAVFPPPRSPPHYKHQILFHILTILLNRWYNILGPSGNPPGKIHPFGVF